MLGPGIGDNMMDTNVVLIWKFSHWLRFCPSPSIAIIRFVILAIIASIAVMDDLLKKASSDLTGWSHTTIICLL